MHHDLDAAPGGAPTPAAATRREAAAPPSARAHPAVRSRSTRSARCHGIGYPPTTAHHGRATRRHGAVGAEAASDASGTERHEPHPFAGEGRLGREDVGPDHGVGLLALEDPRQPEPDAHDQVVVGDLDALLGVELAVRVPPVLDRGEAFPLGLRELPRAPSAKRCTSTRVTSISARARPSLSSSTCTSPTASIVSSSSM